MSENDANKFFECENEISKKTFRDIKEKHKKKFKALQEQQKQELEIQHNKHWFVNLTDTEIPDEVNWLLSHGKKFALPHTKEEFPLLKYIADGEDCIKTIGNKENQEIARNNFTSMIENHMNKHQLSEREKYYLRTVKQTRKFMEENKSIIILEADKGNTTVAMKRLDYDKKMDTIVNDIMTYKRVSSDPTYKLQKKNNELVDELFKNGFINEREKKNMKTDTAVAPRIYGLPKIHKEGHPLRPICSSINAPSTKLCRYITSILNQLTINSKYNVKNSKQFKERIKETNIQDDESFFSLDVVSLFPSVPVELALKIIEEKWKDLEPVTKISKSLFIKILKFCICDNRYFRYKNNFYQQRKGLPMGSAASPIVADIVMEELLDRCMEICDIRPKFLTKYVDDLFGITKSSAINNLLTIFNSYDHRIKFTIEKESNGQLPYLDLLITRKENTIRTNWYQKPTASGRLVNFHSKHPKTIIMNTASNFINRVLNISDKEFHTENIKKITSILTKNSFPLKTINILINQYYKNNKKRQTTEKQNKCYKSVTYIPGLSERFKNSKCYEDNNYSIAPKTYNTLQKLFTQLKPKIDTMDKSNLIYKIKCNGNENEKCQKYYIGTTKNKLKTRLSGHKSDIKNRSSITTQKTALSTHCATEQHHPELERVRVLQCENNYQKRLMLETLHIMNTPTSQRINYKTDTENLANSYRHLIRKINKDIQ